MSDETTEQGGGREAGNRRVHRQEHVMGNEAALARKIVRADEKIGPGHLYLTSDSNGDLHLWSHDPADGDDDDNDLCLADIGTHEPLRRSIGHLIAIRSLAAPLARGLMIQQRPWTPEDGDTRCQECLRPNPTWFTPNEVWNEALGTQDNPRGEGIVLCPTCFLQRADAIDRPEAAAWKIEPGVRGEDPLAGGLGWDAPVPAEAWAVVNSAGQAILAHIDRAVIARFAGPGDRIVPLCLADEAEAVRLDTTQACRSGDHEACDATHSLACECSHHAFNQD